MYMTFRFIHLIWAYHQVYVVQTPSNSNFMLCIYYEDFYCPVIYDAVYSYKSVSANVIVMHLPHL